MSDIPFPVIQEFVNQFQAPEEQGQTGKGNSILFQGTVVSFNTTTKKVTVSVDGANMQVAPYFDAPKWAVGDVVWGIRDGNNRILLGKLGQSRNGLLAYAKVAASTGGASNGRLGGGYGAGVTSIELTTAQAGCGLGVTNVPVTPGHLLRARFKFAAGGPATTPPAFNEWYFLLVVSENSGSYATKVEIRQQPSGINAPSPMGEALYTVPAGVTIISAGIDAMVQNNTGTLYRYSTTLESFQSHFTLEDLGPA